MGSPGLHVLVFPSRAVIQLNIMTLCLGQSPTLTLILFSTSNGTQSVSRADSLFPIVCDFFFFFFHCTLPASQTVASVKFLRPFTSISLGQPTSVRMSDLGACCGVMCGVGECRAPDLSTPWTKRGVGQKSLSPPSLLLSLVCAVLVAAAFPVTQITLGKSPPPPHHHPQPHIPHIFFNVLKYFTLFKHFFLTGGCC